MTVVELYAVVLDDRRTVALDIGLRVPAGVEWSVRQEGSATFRIRRQFVHAPRAVSYRVRDPGTRRVLEYIRHDSVRG